MAWFGNSHEGWHLANEGQRISAWEAIRYPVIGLFLIGGIITGVVLLGSILGDPEYDDFYGDYVGGVKIR